MGRTYHARNKQASGNFGDHTFDVNVSGCHALGYIMKAVDEQSLSIEENQKKYGITDGIPSTRFKMCAADCRRAAKKLRALTDEQVGDIWKQCHFCFEKGAKVNVLEEFINGWASFLETSSGYRVP
jgi:hypothetical protein